MLSINAIYQIVKENLLRLTKDSVWNYEEPTCQDGISKGIKRASLGNFSWGSSA
jgi:hypothetical protein